MTRAVARAIPSKLGFRLSLFENRQSTESSPPKKRLIWVRRGIRWLGFAMLTYAAIVVIGLIPVNNNFEPATEGQTIYVYSGSVHSDLILPTSSSILDWREHFPEHDFGTNVERLSHVAIGWGDRGFFLNTPEWKDLKLATAANAMFLPSDTVMHVRFTGRPAKSSRCRELTISNEAYQELTQFVLSSFCRAEPTEPASVPELKSIDRKFSYGRTDAFYEANGSYHAFNTCNCWVGRGLKQAGVRVPVFTPMPRTVLLYLPSE